MAATMAAALAASLPATTAAPAPVVVTHEAIPTSMVKLIDLESDIPVTCAQLDGLAASKIIKHSREARANTAHGLLLGLDLDGTLEISNSFPLPTHDEEEKASKSSARYQSSMLRQLKEVQADDSVVGFYQATTLGAFFTQSLVEQQALYQERLRHGGVLVIHDLSPTARGNATFRAFRLTPAFLSAHKKSNYTAASLGTHRLTFSSIFEEIPLKIRTSPLLSSFLGSLNKSSPINDTSDAASDSALPPSFSALNLGSSGVVKNLEQIVEAIDNYRTEESNLAYLSRQIAREKSKADQYVQKRKDENVARVAQGLPPLPEEDVSRLFKIPPPPNQLPSMLLLGQLDAYNKSLTKSASVNLVKLYSARAGSA